MKTMTTLALVLGAAAVVAAGGVNLLACSGGSSGGGGGSSSGGHDSGSQDGTGSSSGSSSGGTSSSGGSSGGSSGSSSGGMEAGCKADPSLHPGTAGTVFCGYTDAGSFNCPMGQECCLGGKVGTSFAPEMCGTFGAACTNGTNPLPIECQQPEDCTANGMAGAACCLQGGASAPAAVAGCDPGDLKSSGGTGIICEGAGGGDAGASDAGASPGACKAGELQICEAPSDCPAGKTCTATRWKLYEIGVCL